MAFVLTIISTTNNVYFSLNILTSHLKREIFVLAEFTQ